MASRGVSFEMDLPLKEQERKRTWSYQHPEDWRKEHGLCEDTISSKQSPINIVTKDVVEIDFDDLVMSGYGVEKDISMEMANNGHTVKILFLGANIQINGAGLDGTFRADHLHFHWGENSKLGSEHRIDNKAFSMEMQIVHYNIRYPDVGTACKQPKGLAVLAFMFQVASKPNPAYNEIVSKLAEIEIPGSEVSIETIPLKKLLPAKFREYYRYNGSLTTPDCNETVVWTVFKSPIPISETQLKQFRSLKSLDIDPETTENRFLVNNIRPIQNINDRVIFTNGTTGITSIFHNLCCF